MIERLAVPVVGTECPLRGPGSKDWTLIECVRKINELVEALNLFEQERERVHRLVAEIEGTYPEGVHPDRVNEILYQ